jgi:hypothetical protein
MVTNLIRYFGENVSEGQPLFSHLVSNSSLISLCTAQICQNGCVSLLIDSF